ncbi:hypothetical protein ACP70R_027877 [Stipagrostis hirtigluma subsp. patula]
MEDAPTGNDDLHLSGLPGDGDEDLVAADAEALGFGAGSSDAPINIGGDDGEAVAAGNSPSPSASTCGSGSGGAKSTRSDVWNFFDPLFREENGKSKRIIEERRRRLNSDMVEMLALVKDWEAADARLQHTVEDKELEEAFFNLFLDDQEPPSSSAAPTATTTTNAPAHAQATP